MDVFYDDPENNSTTSAISTNKALLDKANIVPVQATTRRHLQEIISDVGPTPFGSKSLRVSLCRPTPTIADTQREGAEALQGIVAAAQGKDRVTGTLDGKAFELVRGKDFFASATEMELAARASPAST